MMPMWTPLEADPDILTNYIHNLGVSKDFQIVDVLGLDDELLAMLPQPVKAFILLFPISPKYEEHRAREDADLKAAPEDLFFMKQNIPNACGTIALIHAASNAGVPLSPDGTLKSFLGKCQGESSQNCADILGAETSFSTAHEEVAQAGLTPIVENVIHHFIALVEHKGTLYELDGRKSFPVSHGPVESADFAKACARVCREFMARDPDEVNFNIMALAGV